MALIARLSNPKANLHAYGIHIEAGGALTVTPEQAALLEGTGMVLIFDLPDESTEADAAEPDADPEAGEADDDAAEDTEGAGGVLKKPAKKAAAS